MKLSRPCFVFLLAAGSVMLLSGDLPGQDGKSGGKRTTTTKPKLAVRDLPAGVGEYSSRNFVLRTDLAENEANDLLQRLEKMLVLISAYYGKPNSQIIEMNVVKDLKHWPKGSIPAEAMDSLTEEAGITLSMTVAQQNELGEKQIVAAKSIVWAVADRGVPQHEAVHAYCHQNFGRTGPTWYAEGMAELGLYWREKDVSVRIHDSVMEYLKASEPKDLTEITAPGQRTGDSWQNYAWRWALCHLLSTNPNYSTRFKPLGMALLNDQRARFEDVYGPMAKEISFEYLFFLKHMNQGYRSDLCAWDWNRGWQASRVMVKTGDKIQFTTTGEWTLKKERAKISPDGDDDGQGRLVGILFADYKLSEPFDLGRSGEYVAPCDGCLFLRCRDDWCEIADNSGTVTVKFKAAN
jgi:hypothetical protein